MKEKFDYDFKSMKISNSDHARIREYAFYHDMKHYEVIRLALNLLVCSLVERDQDANQPLFQSSEK